MVVNVFVTIDHWHFMYIMFFFIPALTHCKHRWLLLKIAPFIWITLSPALMNGFLHVNIISMFTFPTNTCCSPPQHPLPHLHKCHIFNTFILHTVISLSTVTLHNPCQTFYTLSWISTALHLFKITVKHVHIVVLFFYLYFCPFVCYCLFYIFLFLTSISTIFIHFWNYCFVVFALTDHNKFIVCENLHDNKNNSDSTHIHIRRVSLYSPSGLSAQSCSEVGAGGCWARQRRVCRAHRRSYHWCNGSDLQASVCFYRWHSWNTAEQQENNTKGEKWKSIKCRTLKQICIPDGLIQKY